MKLLRGQSMTEFAVGLAVLALLLLGTITISGYQDVQRRTVIAARQAAFQGAWIGARADRGATVRRIADSHLDDPGLIDAVGQSSLVRPADIAGTATVGPVPGVAHAAATAMVQPLRIAGGFFGSEFDLTTEGLLSGAIRVNVQADGYIPEPFSSMSLEFTEPFALLTDGWNASGPNHVMRRTAGLVPTTTLSSLQSLWQPLLAPLSLIEPSLAQLCLGMIEADRVPEDRVSRGRTPPGRCQ